MSHPSRPELHVVAPSDAREDAGGSEESERRTSDPGNRSMSVTQVYARIERSIDAAFPDAIWVTGEIQQAKTVARGHCYFDLVDSETGDPTNVPKLDAKCWSSRWTRIRAQLDQLGIAFEAGLVVRVRGRIDVYRPRGQISLIVEEVDTDALLGRVAAERARLVRALVAEGLVDRNKALVPPEPILRVGLVASPGTEGHRDFLGRLEASGVGFQVLLVPTQVQGAGAPDSVAAAIRQLGALAPDVIAVVRGGGSKADLATFDAEPIARAIATSPVPVWTGIGHTGDRSVADEVANRVFITPTDCGQALANQAIEARMRVITAAGALAAGAADWIDRRQDLIAATRLRLAAGSRRDVERQWASVRAQAARLRRESQLAVERSGTSVASYRQLLAAYDYRRQLARGYSVTRDSDGRVLRAVDGLEIGARIVTELASGVIESEVASIGRLSAERTEPQERSVP